MRIEICISGVQLSEGSRQPLGRLPASTGGKQVTCSRRQSVSRQVLTFDVGKALKILSTGKYELYHRDLEIRVRFLWTDEGGREGPVFTGYRSLLFLDNEYWGAEFDFKHSNPVYPGETVDASLEIISFGPQARRKFLSRLSVGTKIEICEGKKVVAVGEVTKITELKGAE